MGIRVVQWGSGNVGRSAIVTVASRPDMELVALYVTNTAKVGRDIGALAGIVGHLVLRRRHQLPWYFPVTIGAGAAGGAAASFLQETRPSVVTPPGAGERPTTRPALSPTDTSSVPSTPLETARRAPRNCFLLTARSPRCL